MYLFAVQNLKIRSITHKFLITGHTQNEGDNVHSIIEKAIRRYLKSGLLYIPAQYVSEAKKTGRPYRVNEMAHTDFFDWKAVSASIGSNFSKTEDGGTVKMMDIKVIKVEKSTPNTFAFKTSFSQQAYQKVIVNNRRRKSRY